MVRPSSESDTEMPDKAEAATPSMSEPSWLSATAQKIEQSSPAKPTLHAHDPSSATAPLLLHVVALLKRQSVSLGLHW